MKNLVVSAGVVGGLAFVSPPLLFAGLAEQPDWGEFWSAAGQPYATVLVGMGAITAACLALLNGDRERRQSAEHEDSRGEREIKRDLNDRFSELLNQLADSQPLIRQGAVHGLVALAEDWLAFGDDEQHRVCVSMLASYVRTPMSDAASDNPDLPVRETVMKRLSELSQRRGLKFYRREMNLQGADLRFVSLHQINLNNFWLADAMLTGADLSFADFSGVNLTNANLDDCDLTRTNLTSATLQLTSARRANLRGTNMRKGALFGTDFTDAYIIRNRPESGGYSHLGHDFMSQAPIFTEAYLMGAKLVNADLSGAHLDQARLDFAVFTNALLYCADLTGSSVAGTDFRQADLTDAKIDATKPYYDERLASHVTLWPSEPKVHDR